MCSEEVGVHPDTAFHREQRAEMQTGYTKSRLDPRVKELCILSKEEEECSFHQHPLTAGIQILFQQLKHFCSETSITPNQGLVTRKFSMSLGMTILEKKEKKQAVRMESEFLKVKKVNKST